MIFVCLPCLEILVGKNDLTETARQTCKKTSGGAQSTTHVRCVHDNRVNGHNNVLTTDLKGMKSRFSSKV